MNQFITLTSKRAKDITGQRFGRLVALGPVERTPRGKIKWLCKCDCGKRTTVIGKDIRSGNTKSCGCLTSEMTTARNRTHGKAHTRLYRIWAAMKERCTNPNNKDYHSYGGRGIAVCDEWMESFQAFFDHVSKLPHFDKKGRSLDRINNSLGYLPGNVRWATSHEQARNLRKTVRYTWGGQSLTVGQWAKIVGMNYRTLHTRLRELGWSIKDALTTPIRKHRRTPIPKIAKV